MITTKQYDEALVRLMELNNMYIVPGDKEDLEQQHLLDLRAQYEAEHDNECQAEYEDEKKRKQEANDQISMSMGYL